VHDGAPTTLVVDGPSSGRGAWLCRSERAHSDTFIAVEGCLERAVSQQQFSRAWRTTLGPDDVEAIRAALRRDEEPTS